MKTKTILNVLAIISFAMVANILNANNCLKPYPIGLCADGNPGNCYVKNVTEVCGNVFGGGTYTEDCASVDAFRIDVEQFDIECVSDNNPHSCCNQINNIEGCYTIQSYVCEQILRTSCKRATVGGVTIWVDMSYEMGTIVNVYECVRKSVGLPQLQGTYNDADGYGC